MDMDLQRVSKSLFNSDKSSRYSNYKLGLAYLQGILFGDCNLNRGGTNLHSEDLHTFVRSPPFAVQTVLLNTQLSARMSPNHACVPFSADDRRTVASMKYHGRGFRARGVRSERERAKFLPGGIR